MYSTIRDIDIFNMDKLPPKIFILDSDMNIPLCNAMNLKWIDVIRYTDYKKALNYLNNNEVHLIILSSRIYNISAIEMMIQIRKIKYMSNIPIIFLIDEAESRNNYKIVMDKSVSIVPRTIDSNLLISKIKKTVEIAKLDLIDSKITYKNITVDLSSYLVLIDNIATYFSKIEFEIIKLFVTTPKVIYKREEILSNISKDIQSARSLVAINVHISKIRKLIKSNLNDSAFIYTVKSSGYYLL